MAYENINKVNVDGNGNLILQDVSGKNITINHNDVDALNKLLAEANKTLLADIQKVVSENKNAVNKDFSKIIEEHKKLLADNSKEKKSRYTLKTVLSVLGGIVGIISLIKANSLENVDIPYYAILFFVVLIPIVISFIIMARNKEKQSFKRGAVLIYWLVIVISSAFVVIMFTSAFFDYPKPLCEYPFINCKSKNIETVNEYYSEWQGMWYAKRTLQDIENQCSKINFINQGDTLLVDNAYVGDKDQSLLATLSANGDTCKGIVKNNRTNTKIASFVFVKNDDLNLLGSYRIEGEEIDYKWIASRDGTLVQCEDKSEKDKAVGKAPATDPNAFKTQDEICRTKLMEMRAAGTTKSVATRTLPKGTYVYLLVDSKITKVKLPKRTVSIIDRYEDVFFFVLPALVLSTDNVVTYSERQDDKIFVRKRVHARFDDENYDWLGLLYLTPNSRFKYCGETKLKIVASKRTFYKFNLWGYVEL